MILPAIAGLLCAGQFPTPKSPTIPAKITMEGDTACHMEYSALSMNGEWSTLPAGYSVTKATDETAFTAKAWGLQHLYLKITGRVPDFVTGRPYKARVSLRLESKATADLMFPPELMLFKPSQSAFYTKDSVWPTNYTASKPDHIIGGSNLVFNGSSGTNGFTDYEVSWTSSLNFANAESSVWIWFLLSSRPENDPVTYHISEVCIERVAEESDPPPTIPAYSERVELLTAPAPPHPVLTQQRECPWDESGLVTWKKAVGTSTGTISLPANTKVLADASSFPADTRFTKITVPESSELIFADDSIAFAIKALVVKGKLRIGSEACRVEGPINITFWGSNSDPDSTLDGYGTKGLVGLPGSTVDIFGRRFYPTWTRLSRKARAADDRAYLQQSVNWYPGQEVVVTTTVWDDTDKGQPNQNEVMTIKAVSPDGKIVQFSEPLRYTHYAGTEYQGEIALLSRHVNIEGEPDDEGFGGHLLVAGETSTVRIAGVAARYMGQTNVMARYPFHFHLMGKSPESYLSDNVARDTYFRCFVIHGTHEVLETENVAFNATGNCFYVEDGIEENNTVSYNLAAYVRPLGKGAKGDPFTGEVFYEADDPGGLTSGKMVQPADSTACGFYFSNSYNTIIGNVASGGWSGFGFPGLPLPIGNFASTTDFEPQSRPMKRFYGNVAHSSGAYWYDTGCIYVGGKLETQADGKLKYSSGRFSRGTRAETEPGYQDWEGTPLFMRLENTLTYACNKGIFHWGARVEVVQAEMHDVLRGATLFGECWLDNALINGASGNIDADFVNKHHDGFQFYDQNVKSMLTNVEFRNFKRSKCVQIAIPGDTAWEHNDVYCGPFVAELGAHLNHHFNIAISGLYGGDAKKPFQISATKNIKYSEVDEGGYISNKVANVGSSRFFNFVDWDGTATLEGVPTIVGSYLNWWQVCDDCRFEERWQTWLCPKQPDNYPEREVAHVVVETPGVKPADGGMQESACILETDATACNVGYMALWGHGSGFGDNKRFTPLTQNSGTTGLSGTGWYMWLDGGAAGTLTIQPLQVVGASRIRFATSYPSGTSFTVTAEQQYGSTNDKTYTLATDMADLEAAPLSKYYFDGAAFYIILLMPDDMRNSKFERGGGLIYGLRGDYTITVEANCGKDAKGFCKTKPTEKIPPWTEACPTRSLSPAPVLNTSSPVTQPPDTDAPDSSAPATVPPFTQFPSTAAVSPTTGSPVSGAPTTSAPATQQPMPGSTGSPQTESPSGAPSTNAPSTTAPASNAPDTVGPATSAPVATNAPETRLPANATASNAPDSRAPATNVSAPATGVPAQAPPTAEPDTLPPSMASTAPGAPPVVSVPGTQAPATGAPSQTTGSLTPTTSPTVTDPPNGTTGPPDLGTSAPLAVPRTDSPSNLSLTTSAPETGASRNTTEAPESTSPLSLEEEFSRNELQAACVGKVEGSACIESRGSCVGGFCTVLGAGARENTEEGDPSLWPFILTAGLLIAAAAAVAAYFVLRGKRREAISFNEFVDAWPSEEATNPAPGPYSPVSAGTALSPTQPSAVYV
ncbi:hypothetical protein DIPPA_34120 [Diplonema papillatum]|nr:hypothetical protein DIPPA_34120 [Diplonema papillatum]